MHERIDVCGVFSDVTLGSYLLVSCYALRYVNLYIIKTSQFVFYPPFARRAKGEVFVLLYVCLLVCSVNDFSTTRGPIHAKVRMQAYSGSGCVFSPFGGWRPPAAGKRGKWNFRYYGSQWGIFAFWQFLSDISATLARIYTKYYLCRDNVCRRAPSPCGAHRPLGGGGRGS